VETSKIANKAVSAALAISAVMPYEASAADSENTSSAETIIFIRHGEKPKQGLGQLDCQGLNRALALPKVLEAQFGKPAAIFAPNPSQVKDDGGKSYDYVRPLATIEPSAIYFGLPVDTTYGFAETDKLKEALEQPDYRGAKIVVAWEHRLIDVLAKKLMQTHGGAEDAVPEWQGADYDSIYVVTINWPSNSITFKLMSQGLNGLPTACPA
jgi:broad specificity phosphatase PhoE